MIRRSRISVRPNVKPTGRGLPASRGDAPVENSKTPSDLSHVVEVKAGGEEVRPAASVPAGEANDKTEIQIEDVLPQPQTSGPAGDSEAQSTTTSEPSSVSMIGPQRRKRFAVLPNLAKPRTTSAPTHTSSRTPKSPVKASLLTPEPEPTDPVPAVKATSDSRGRRRFSGAGKSKAVDPLQVSPKTSTTSLEQKHEKLDINKSANQDAEFTHPSKNVQSETAALSENHPESHKPEISEAETSVHQENKLASTENAQSSPQKDKTHPHSMTQIPLSLKTLNDPMDRLRLAKAKKLRELLKKEMNKDKQNEKQQRPKMGTKERKTAKDHTKMTMRDLIYYLPSTNPMKSYVEDEQRATEIVLPSSPKEVPAAPPSVREEEEEEDVEAEEERTDAGGGGGAEEPLLAPRVKVAEDGSLIIDEESLTVEVLRVKGPNPAEERDPIFERGSTTTYSSFRKGTYTKPWSNRETDMFFLAISMVGTDFSMIGQLFPHRARIEIKNKFKKEERANSWRIDKAFKERRRLDLDFFNNLLEKILKEEEKKRKKKKDTAKLPKIPRTPQRTSAAVKKRKVCYSSGSEEESSGSDVMEGEKENEGMSNDRGSSASPITPRRKSIKKNKAADLAEENAESGAAEGQSTADRLQKADSVVKSESSCISRAQLKGRAQRVTPNLERRWKTKGPTMQRKAQETDTPTQEQSNTDKSQKVSTTPAREKSKTSDVISCGLEYSEEEEEPDLTVVQEHILNKPTRSGRIPKLSQHVIRAVVEEDEVEEQNPSSYPPSSESQGSVRRVRKKPGPSLKRGIPRRGKSRLVTLRALASEEEEDEDDGDTVQEEGQYSPNAEEEQNQAFVPMALRSQPLVQTVVEETMEELDISVNVPEVLGISHSSVCSESSCEKSLGGGGSVPCEHQLDLLVDVIEFLAPEQMEVSEESYTEAARTLLTIGHSAQMVEAPCAEDDVIIVEEPLAFGQQDIQQEVILETTDQSETGDETCQIVTSNICVISEGKDDLDMASKVNLEQVSSRASTPETSQQVFSSVEEPVISQETEILPSNSQSEASNNKAPQTGRNRLLKPKPKLSRSSRPTKAQQKQTSPEKGNNSIIPTTASVKAATGDQTVESNLLTDISKVSTGIREDTFSVVSSESEPKETSSKFPDQRAPENEDQSNSELERKQESEVPEVNTAGQKLQPQQTHRRCRGPKPKPNLIQSSRNTRTQQKTSQSTAVSIEKQAAVKLSTESFTDTQRPQDGEVVTKIKNQMQEETETADSVKAVSSSNLQNRSATVSKQDNTSTEKTRGDSEEIMKSLQVEQPGTSEIISSDHLLDSDHSSTEPVFILSLTEVPPTLTETKECTAKSELQSEPVSASPADVEGPNPARDQVSHQLLSDVFVSVSEEQQEEKEMDVDEKVETKECKKEKGNKEESSRQIVKRGHSLLEQDKPAEKSPSEQHAEASLSSAADGISKETDHSAKRRKLPERGRRAKLQVKPNPVQRKAICSLSSPSLSEEITSTPASSQQESAPDPFEDFTCTLISPEDFPHTAVSHERTKASSVTPKDTFTIPVISPSTSEDISVTLSQSSPKPPEAPSPDIMRREGLSERKTLESVSEEGMEASVSGAESQPAHQITPLSTTGPLTRPGRRPRGFLSFMSNTSTQGPSSATRGATAGPLKVPINTARSERKRATPGPLTSASRPASALHRTSRDKTSQKTQPSTDTPAPAPQTSNQNPDTEEEPESVSAYFFSDIFTMVDEQEIESE